MFEKDDDYYKAREESKDRITKVIKAWCAREEVIHDGGFEKGAEFGYNKANEWHYVKDEKDLPTDKKEYLLLLGRGIKTFGFYNGRFWESRKGNFSWQEVKAYFFISVPELKESE